MNVFESCRHISASDIAVRIGLPLKQRGEKQWACCPIHVEKTPSLMFDAKGHWHCFGCGRGGDAVAFYGALYHLQPKEAALELARLFDLITTNAHYVPSPAPPERRLKERVEAWFFDEWHKACEEKHGNNDLILSAVEHAHLNGINQDDCMSWNLFGQALQDRSEAEIRLEILSCASKRDLLYMMLEERDAER